MAISNTTRQRLNSGYTLVRNYFGDFAMIDDVLHFRASTDFPKEQQDWNVAPDHIEWEIIENNTLKITLHGIPQWLPYHNGQWPHFSEFIERGSNEPALSAAEENDYFL